MNWKRLLGVTGYILWGVAIAYFLFGAIKLLITSPFEVGWYAIPLLPLFIGLVFLHFNGLKELLVGRNYIYQIKGKLTCSRCMKLKPQSQIINKLYASEKVKPMFEFPKWHLALGRRKIERLCKKCAYRKLTKEEILLEEI